MEIGQLRKEINDLLENIVEHSSNYSNNRPIPSLEVSYVLKKVNRMQETLIILKHLLEQEELRIKQSRSYHAQQTPSSTEVPAPVIEIIKEDPLPSPAEFVETPESTPEPITEFPTSEATPEEKITLQDEPLIDSDAQEEQHPEKPVRSALESRPIARLIDALTLNDRYLYANELFNKDMNAFNELVKALDNCSKKEDANGIIAQFNEQWDQDNEHVLSFFELVDRRFMES